jgi:hypothetical protein
MMREIKVGDVADFRNFWAGHRRAGVREDRRVPG